MWNGINVKIVEEIYLKLFLKFNYAYSQQNHLKFYSRKLSNCPDNCLERILGMTQGGELRLSPDDFLPREDRAESSERSRK